MSMLDSCTHALLRTVATPLTNASQLETVHIMQRKGSQSRALVEDGHLACLLELACMRIIRCNFCVRCQGLRHEA
jgi:hypothetical protein